MKVAVVLCSLMALSAAAPGYLAAPGYVAGPSYLGAPAIVRTPQYDSAVIQSDRVGGNFAYSTVEAQAYAAVSPVVSRVVSPVAVSYHATPVVAPAPLVAAPLYAPAAHGHYVL
uniref:Cuticle protein n=1 Tax=Graphocephala atropunctata TaxID=36148 RepID=A0A1B6LV00_9HEMI